MKQQYHKRFLIVLLLISSVLSTLYLRKMDQQFHAEPLIKVEASEIQEQNYFPDLAILERAIQFTRSIMDIL